MERHLLLSFKKGVYNKQKVAHEVNTIKKLLPCFESFETFVAYNEIFDLLGKSFIVHVNKLRTIFDGGLINNKRYNVVGKN